MRRNALIFTLTAISLALISTAAFSQPSGHPGRFHGGSSDKFQGRQQERHHNRHDGRRPEQHHERRDDRRHDRRHEDRHEGRQPGNRPGQHAIPSRPHHPPQVRQEHHRYSTPRPVGDASRFHRGRPLPKTYHHHHHVLHHWHDHHLHRPPHGHHWVVVDSHYLLVAIATGIVVDILIAD